MGHHRCAVEKPGLTPQSTALKARLARQGRRCRRLNLCKPLPHSPCARRNRQSSMCIKTALPHRMVVIAVGPEDVASDVQTADSIHHGKPIRRIELH